MGKINFKKRSAKKIPQDDITLECEGFKIMRLKYSEESEVTHYVLAKEHSVREKNIQKPEDRTIFLRGIPPFVTQNALIAAFRVFGGIRDVFFHQTPCASTPPSNTSKFFEDTPQISGFKVAYLVFHNADSVRKAMLSPPEQNLILFPSEVTSTVVDEWVNEYNSMVSLDAVELKTEVDKYMATYDKTVQDKGLNEKLKQEEDADEGWITVNKKSGIPRKESVHKQIMKKQDNKLKKSQLMNFYRFQIKESKMNQLMKLREKFEEDKKRISQLKESRKFKPF